MVMLGTQLEYRSPTHLLLKMSLYEGQPMRRKLYQQEGNSLFHTLTAAIRPSTVNQGLKQRVGNQHNRSSLKENKNRISNQNVFDGHNFWGKKRWRETPTHPPLALSFFIYLYLFAGDITQKGYEKKRSKLVRAYVPHAGGNLATSDSPTHSPRRENIPIPLVENRSGIMTNTVAMILYSTLSIQSSAAAISECRLGLPRAQLGPAPLYLNVLQSLSSNTHTRPTGSPAAKTHTHICVTQSGLSLSYIGWFSNNGSLDTEGCSIREQRSNCHIFRIIIFFTFFFFINSFILRCQKNLIFLLSQIISMFIFLCWPSYLLLLSNVFVHVCVCLCLSIYVCICRCLSACLCRYGGANVSPGPPRPSLCGPFPPTENLRHQRRALQIRYGNYSCINTTIGSLRLLI